MDYLTQLTGTSQILHSATATALLPHSKLAVKLTVSSSRFVRRGLPFRAVPGEPSPYNPPAWPLSCERSTLSSSFPPSITSQFTASLTRRDILSPTIARFAFLVSSPSSSSVCGNRDEGKEEGKKLQWQPGQHISLNFAPELDIGYAHVRDDDPGSLNDDFVRTFTISSPPAPRRSPEDGDNASKIPSVVELEITARLHGPATALLFKHPVGRVPLDIPVLGVGGEERLRVTSSANPEDDDPNRGSGAKSVFIASGVGVTPLLAQAPSLLEKGLSVEFEVFWTIRKEDLGLVKDSVERIKGLGERVRLFVTGVTAAGDSEGGLDSSSNLVRSLKTRRMRREDVLGDGMAGKRKYFCCTGPALKKELDGWLDGEDVAWEDFGY
ncbi:oxidoreductase FAD-binding domain-containing protein [Zalerion maritima]|uniref:Oxidoreductase FAD-binding domain-containing protein n=1 Tax=Zalerion maritima TaxID=339359 RepID=A0AAD5WNW1_9PEZI|nr:oxidoreductase FAD-binding domain-containing protein [Zalerion maritima]